MVSEWMEDGNINQLIEKDKHVDRTKLVGCPQSPRVPD